MEVYWEVREYEWSMLTGVWADVGPWGWQGRAGRTSTRSMRVYVLRISSFNTGMQLYLLLSLRNA